MKIMTLNHTQKNKIKKTENLKTVRKTIDKPLRNKNNRIK